MPTMAHEEKRTMSTRRAQWAQGQPVDLSQIQSCDLLDEAAAADEQQGTLGCSQQSAYRQMQLMRMSSPLGTHD